MVIIGAIYLGLWLVMRAAIIFIIALMLVRMILNYSRFNPFSRWVMTVRRVADPLVNPVRRVLLGFGVNPNIAPLITILIAILLYWFALQLVSTVLNTAAGIVLSLESAEIIALAGYLLYGLLALYSLLIFIRIIFAWGMVSYRNRIMRFLIDTTDPLLVPLRRVIPPLGAIDISPIIAFFILMLFQQAIAGTLLHGMNTQFVG